MQTRLRPTILHSLIDEIFWTICYIFDSWRYYILKNVSIWKSHYVSSCFQFYFDMTLLFFENLMLNCEAEKFVNDEKKMSFDKRFCVIRNYFYSWIYVSWNTCTNVRCESPHTYRGKEKERYTVHDCQETHHY